MKIGFSFGRCIRDIVNGEVNINDVAFLITATYIRDEAHIANVVGTYIHEPEYLMGLDYDQCMKVALDLWNTNRVIQPRAQGMHRHKQPENSVWVDMFPTKASDNEAVKAAWEKYRFMLHMTENVDNEALETFK